MSKGFLRQENHFTVEFKRDNFLTGNYTLEIRREVVHLHSLFLLTEWLVNLTLEHGNQRATIDSLRCLILWWNLTASWHAFGRRLSASQAQLQVLKAQWRRLSEANSSFLQQFLQDVIQCCQDECRWLNLSIIGELRRSN